MTTTENPIVYQNCIFRVSGNRAAIDCQFDSATYNNYELQAMHRHDAALFPIPNEDTEKIILLCEEEGL